MVDPLGSVFSNSYQNQVLNGKSYLVEGVGKSLVPGVIDFDIVDHAINISDEEAFAMCQILPREEGILGGGSGGCNVWGAIQLA